MGRPELDGVKHVVRSIETPDLPVMGLDDDTHTSGRDPVTGRPVRDVAYTSVHGTLHGPRRVTTDGRRTHGTPYSPPLTPSSPKGFIRRRFSTLPTWLVRGSGGLRLWDR